jgi:uncharacterized protein (DUF486 family)
MKTVILLTISNLFMTLAWYGHLKYLRGARWPLFVVILISWGIAFFEYCFQVPANRIGYASFSATQLKVIQEIISLTVFSVFAILMLGEKLRWTHAVSFLFLLGAVYFAFMKSKPGGI